MNFTGRYLDICIEEWIRVRVKHGKEFSVSTRVYRGYTNNLAGRGNSSMLECFKADFGDIIPDSWTLILTPLGDKIIARPPGSTMPVVYPNVTVKLSDEDGNIFAIVGRVNQAMKAAGITAAEIQAFDQEVINSRSYDAALQVVMAYVEVE